MRVSAAISLLLVCAPLSAQFKDVPYGELYESEVVASLRTHIGNIAAVANEGRKAGSEGETAAAAYVEEQFRKYGLDLLSPRGGDLFGIRQENGDTLTSRNVAGVISGYDNQLKHKYIVIGARLDGIGDRVVCVDGVNRTLSCPGANANASGLAMLLQLSQMLQTNRVLLKRSVVLVAFGASAEMNAGSWYFLNRSFVAPDDIDVMINLDMLGTGSRGFFVYTSSNPDLNNDIDALASTLQPVQPKIVSMQPVVSDHQSFYSRGIPSAMFTSGMYPEYNSEKDTPSIIEYDWMERELEYIYNFSVRMANGRKPEFGISAEQNSKAADDKVVAYSDCDVPPMFLGSADPSVFLKKWVYTYLRYPQDAVRDGVQGRVLLDFVVDEKGKVKDVQVLKGISPELDEEAVRVIRESPDWRPGRVRGVKVRTRLSIYVEFRLRKKK